MDPQQTNQIPSMELPKPQVEPMPESGASPESIAQPVTEADMAKKVELDTSGQAPSQAVDPVQAAAGAATTPFDPAQMVPTAPAANPQNDLPVLAEDSDLIEKEWVEKAKRIVEQTRTDPHVQNKEMNKMKADYLKKRYNKDLKLVEE